MNIKLYLITLLLSSLFITACQKVIDIDVNTSTSQLVIEGNITDIRGPQYVIISRSVAYTEKNIYPTVSGADVRVTDNLGNTWRFTEIRPGTYAVSSMRGITGRSYMLRVVLDGTEYTATSVMPLKVQVDSLSLADITFGSTTRKQVAVNYTDPKGQPNQYRYIMYVNGKQTTRIYAYDDRLTDGNIRKDELFTDDDNENEDLKSGDKVTIEVQNIDKNNFNYWFTLRQQRRGGPGGGVTPGNPPSNLSNNALGYFSAHTYQTIDVTIP
jgi:hypothetical protein